MGDGYVVRGESRYVKEGYFVVINGVNRSTNYAFNQTRVTPQGVEFIRKTLGT